MPRKFFFIFLPLILALPSCSSSSDAETTNSAVALGAARPQGLDRFEGGYRMEKDEETGFMRPVSEREGTPFSEKTNYFRKNNEGFKKSFSKAEYDARRWQGADKKKSLKAWSRENDDFQYSPQFIKDNADIASRKASETNKSFSRSVFKKKYASEQASNRIEKMPDYVVKKAQEVFHAPKIISQRSYQEDKRSVEEVKSLLGN